MKHIHWVIVAEWCVDYEGGYSVVGVYHSEDEACKAFTNRVSTDDRLLAEEYGYKIYEDSQMCFDSGRDGEYSTDHITVSVHKIESEDE